MIPCEHLSETLDIRGLGARNGNAPPLRIVVLAPGYATEANPTGYVFHRTACEALARAGAQPRVVVPVAWAPWPLRSISARWGQYARIPQREQVDGITVEHPRYVQIPRGNRAGWPHRAFARLLRNMLAPDDLLIHAHFAYPCGLAAARVAGERNIPCVLTLHGSDVNRFPGMSKTTRRLFQEAVLGATTVIAVSEALANRTEQLTDRRPTVLPIGVDLRRFQSPCDPKGARRALGLA